VRSPSGSLSALHFTRLHSSFHFLSSAAMTVPPVSMLRRLLHGFAWTMVGSVVARSGAFVGMFLAARALGKSDFGRLGAILNTVGLLGVIAGFGLGLTATTWVSRLRQVDPARAGRLAGALLWAGGSAGIVLAIVLAGTAWWFAGTVFEDPTLTLPLALSSALVPLNVLFGIQSGVITGCGNFSRLAKVNIVAGIAALPAVWLGAIWYGLVGAVVGLVLAQAIVLAWSSRVVGLTMAQAGLRIDGRQWWREWHLIVGFSMPTALASVMVIPVNWLSSAWLVRTADFAELGMFNAGNTWRMLIIFIPLQFVTASLPTLADARGRGDRRTFNRTCAIALAVSGGVAVAIAGVVAIGADTMLALFGDEFAGGSAVLIVLAWSALPMALNNVMGAAITGAGLPWRNAAATGVYALAALGALIFIPASALGLAWAQLVACLLATCVYAVLLLGLRFPTEDSSSVATA